jgi:hypothetical protein
MKRMRDMKAQVRFLVIHSLHVFMLEFPRKLDKAVAPDHIFPSFPPMKIPLACSLVLCAALPALAVQPSPGHTNNSNIPKKHISSPVPTKDLAPAEKPAGAASTAAAPAPAASTPPPVAPAAAAPPKTGLTLDTYVAALGDELPLSKDEQTDIKVYYEDDGAKLKGILDNAALSPLEQQQQVDDLRAARDAKIDALLEDVGRQAKFAQMEQDYRVALVELAARGGLVPASPPPIVPDPTGTTPAQAEKNPPGNPKTDASAGS